MLNHFLRYFEVHTENNNEDWIADSDAPLKGFSWRGGCKSDTTGILMWSKPLIITINGKKLAILLMDTQGLFDGSLTFKGCVTVVSLSLLVSSIQGLFFRILN